MEEKKIRLVFAGDLLPADRHHTPGIGLGNKITIGEELWCDEILQLFLSANLSVVNLEAPIVTNPGNKYSFAGKPNILSYLKKARITHANIANNHMLEHKTENWLNTISLLKGMGIEPLGIQENGISNIAIKELNGIQISMAGFNALHDIPNPGCYADLTDESVFATLKSDEMKNAEIRVLIFHWGNEYIHIPSWQQIQLARKCIENGAHIIIGHHPHVVQPVEEYKGGLICYSLGNFVFDMFWSKSVRTGLVMEIDVDKQGIAAWKAHGVRYDGKLQTQLLKSDWLTKRLAKWHKKMKQLEAKGEAAYTKAYFRELKINRFIARLQMKRQLLMQIPRMSSIHQQEVFKSLMGKIKY